MNQTRFITLLVSLLFAVVTHAQNYQLSGTVVDETGEPIIGASVVDKATNFGTVTDVNGKFSFDVPLGTELTISYVGYADYKLRATQNMEIKLKPNTQLLNDVVVVGYGSQKKVDVTGSISSVTGKDIARSPMANITAILTWLS